MQKSLKNIELNNYNYSCDPAEVGLGQSTKGELKSGVKVATTLLMNLLIWALP